jgi:hypothetical protein
MLAELRRRKAVDEKDILHTVHAVVQLMLVRCTDHPLPASTVAFCRDVVPKLLRDLQAAAADKESAFSMQLAK